MRQLRSIVVAASGVSMTALAASLITCGYTVDAFPISRIQNHHRRPKRMAVYTLPPSLDDDLDTEQKKIGNSGQMESLRRSLFAELEKMRNQFTEMTESLNKAREREVQAQGTVANLKENQQSVEKEKKNAIDSKKSEFV